MYYSIVRQAESLRERGLICYSSVGLYVGLVPAYTESRLGSSHRGEAGFWQRKYSQRRTASVQHCRQQVSVGGVDQR
jgi:hypothetical protein